MAQKYCSLTAVVELGMKQARQLQKNPRMAPPTTLLKQQCHQLQFHYRKQELKTELRHYKQGQQTEIIMLFPYSLQWNLKENKASFPLLLSFTED